MHSKYITTGLKGCTDSVPMMSFAEITKTRSRSPEKNRNLKGWILHGPSVAEQVEWTAKKLIWRCGYTPSDLEDLKQDMRVYLIKNEAKYDPDRGSVGAYVCCLLKSWAQMRIRYRLQQRRRGRLSTRPFEDAAEPMDASESETMCAFLETIEVLEACLLRLSPDQAQLVRDVVNLGQTQTASMLSISRRQLKNRRDQIRDICSDLDDFLR